jgi:hypothetical protein
MLFFFIVKFLSFVVFQAFGIWWNKYSSYSISALIFLFLIQVGLNFKNGYGLLSLHLIKGEIIGLFLLLLILDVGMYLIVKLGKNRRK